MKRKKWLFGIAFALFCIMLSACRCAPYETKWYIQQATFEKSFLNGNKVEVTVGNHAYYAQPDALYDGNAHIQFYEDGTVAFQPIDGAALTGTYTYSHNGFKDTGFRITFSDGSEVTDGVAVSYYGGRELSFTHRGVCYAFGDRGYTSEGEHQENIAQIAYVMRSPYYTDRFPTATTTKGENGKWQITEVVPTEGEPLDIYAEGLALEAVHITANNEVILLDDLMEGECFVVMYEDMVGMQKVSHAVFYYVDPLPKEPTVEDMTLGIEEMLPWLPEVLQKYESTQIKITSSATNLPVGFTEYHQYLRDSEEVRQYLENLNTMRLWSEEKKDFSGNHKKYTIQITVGEEVYAFTSIEDYLVIGEELYQFMDGDRVAKLPNIDYSQAVKTFVTADKTEVYNKKTYLYSVTDFWQDLEFVIDTEEHNWNFAQETRTLVCDFGEVTVYDNVHFYYKGQNYIAVGNQDFSQFFQ